MTDQWGQVQGTRSIIPQGRDAAPKLSLITRDLSEKGKAFLDLDPLDITFGTKVEKPQQGTCPFGKVNYKKNQMLRFDLRELPEYSRLVFDAGPFTGEGAADDGSWTAQFALSDPEYQAGLNLDKRFLECATALKDEMYPAQSGKKSMNQEAFEEKFVSRFKAGDPEKGYAPTVKAFVEHRDFDKDGKPLRKCKVYKAELEDDGVTITKPVPGDVSDLKQGAAVVAFGLYRGWYIMPKSMGGGLTLESAIVITNKCETNESMPSLDRVNVKAEPAAEHLGEGEAYERRLRGGRGGARPVGRAAGGRQPLSRPELCVCACVRVRVCVCVSVFLSVPPPDVM